MEDRNPWSDKRSSEQCVWKPTASPVRWCQDVCLWRKQAWYKNEKHRNESWTGAEPSCEGCLQGTTVAHLIFTEGLHCQDRQAPRPQGKPETHTGVEESQPLWGQNYSIYNRIHLGLYFICTCTVLNYGLNFIKIYDYSDFLGLSHISGSQLWFHNKKLHNAQESESHNDQKTT